MFCSHLADNEDSRSIILRLLALQLLQARLDLAALIWDRHVCNAHSPSIEVLQKLLPDLISGIGKVRIVVDGLDERPVVDYVPVLTLLFALAKKSSCSILISSRDENVLRSKLRSKPTITLREEKSAVANDMSIFVKARLCRAVEEWDLRLSKSTRDKGEQELLRLSHGLHTHLLLGFYDADFVRHVPLGGVSDSKFTILPR